MIFRKMTKRPWGYYDVIFQSSEFNPRCKVKRLVLKPYSKMSRQRHFKRSEFWLILKGQCVDEVSKATLGTGDTMIVEQGQWHQLSNMTSKVCTILEVQYGYYCGEDDIERA